MTANLAKISPTSQKGPSPSPSPTIIDWDEAEHILKQQDALRRRLQGVFDQNVVASGLYYCHDDDDDEASFSRACRHIRRFLATSPRTVLRCALNSFQKELGPLCDVLQLDSSNATTNDMHTVIRAAEKVTPGKCHRKYEKLKKESPLAADEIRDMIRRSLMMKQNNSRGINEHALETAVQRARQNQTKRQLQVEEDLIRLKGQLETDVEYLHYKQVHQHLVRPKLIWDNFSAVDLAICQKRGNRGAALEEHGWFDCFAMIALEFLKRHPEYMPSDMTHVRNTHWWDKDGKKVGEIDLAVLCRGRVVAICEMKTSCFEIAAAIRQHERKLAPLSSSLSGTGWTMTMGPSSGESLDYFHETPPRLYFATLLPSGNEWMVGAEPLLVNAVCEGIRAQNLGIADAVTEELCRPLIPLLRQSGCVNQALAYLQNMKVPSAVSTGESDELDYSTLHKFVQERIGSIHAESPAACLERYYKTVLVVVPKQGSAACLKRYQTQCVK